MIAKRTYVFRSQLRALVSWCTSQLPGHEIGINPQYTIGPVLEHFFLDNWTQAHVRQMEVIRQRFQQQRELKMNEFSYHEPTLSYAFWCYIYNGSDYMFGTGSHNILPRWERLEIALALESNPLMQGLAVKHTRLLDMLYNDCLGFYNASYRNALWFLFWHDLWKKNGEDVKIMQANEHLFNPNLYFQAVHCMREGGMKKFKCLAYNYKEREDLVAVLDKKQFHGKKGFLRQGWINDEMLDTLYGALDAADKLSYGGMDIPLAPEESRAQRWGIAMSSWKRTLGKPSPHLVSVSPLPE